MTAEQITILVMRWLGDHPKKRYLPWSAGCRHHVPAVLQELAHPPAATLTYGDLNPFRPAMWLEGGVHLPGAGLSYGAASRAV